MTQFDGKNRLAQRIFVILLFVLFAGVSVQYSLKALKGKSAIIRWSSLIQEIDTGEDVYKQSLYPNPPIMALMLEPLAILISNTGTAMSSASRRLQ